MIGSKNNHLGLPPVLQKEFGLGWFGFLKTLEPRGQISGRVWIRPSPRVGAFTKNVSVRPRSCARMLVGIPSSGYVLIFFFEKGQAIYSRKIIHKPTL